MNKLAFFLEGFKLRLSHEVDEEGRIYLKASLRRYEFWTLDGVSLMGYYFPPFIYIDLERSKPFRYWSENESKAILLDDFAKVSEIKVVKEIQCQERKIIPKPPQQAVKAYAELTGQNVVAIHTPPVVRGCSKPKRRPKIVCLFEA